MSVNPGEIYVCRGYGKPRPVVVVSREEFNRGDYFLAVPLTSTNLAMRRTSPSCVVLQRGEAGLDRECVAQCEATTLMNLSYIDIDAGPVGKLGSASMSKVVHAIGHVIEAECTPTQPNSAR
jgi:mRNA-degrading endonuclease toxin of MazEF toxin-antitoxin module